MELLLIFLIFISLIPIKVKAQSYILGFKSDKDIIWEMTYINHTLTQLLINENIMSESFKDNIVGQQTKYYIERIEFNNDGGISHWKVIFHIYIGSNLQNNQGTEDGNGWHKNVAKNPEDVALNWASSTSLFTNRFMPLNISKYLANLVITIGKNNISSSGPSLIYNNTINGENHMRIFTYNQNGIRNISSRYFNGLLVYKSELVYYGKSYTDWGMLWDALLIIGIVVVFCGILLYALIDKPKRVKNKKESIKTKFKI